MKILMVLTSHDELGNTGKKTGFWLDEFAAPYYVFKDAKADVTLVSPKGGQPPIDPNSDAADAQTKATARFKADPDAQKTLADTRKLSDVEADGFDAIFYVGGHGPLWDLADNEASQHLIEAFYGAEKPVAAVCHGPAAFRNARGPFGFPMVRGRNVTGFSNAEEATVGLTKVVPFLVEDMLTEKGGEYSSKPPGQSHVITDANLVTGQNPASSADAAKAVLALLK